MNMESNHQTLLSSKDSSRLPVCSAGNSSSSKANDSHTSASMADLGPPSYSSRSSFASVSLHKTDRIRFLHFPRNYIEDIVGLVEASWSEGIQKTKQYAESCEVKLKGNPWAYNPAGNLLAKRLIRLLFEGLHNLGWKFDSSIRMCKKPEEKDTLVFSTRFDEPLPPPREWLAISCDVYSVITVQCGPVEFIERLRQQLERWTVTTLIDDSKMQIILKGHPWKSQGEDTMQVRHIFLVVREILEDFGFGIHASLAMANSAGQGETDLLICSRSSQNVSQ